MSLLNQKTINKKITISGIGLHSGKNVNLKILPSKENTGIVFLRSEKETFSSMYKPSIWWKKQLDL